MADERQLGAIVEASPIGKRTYELCGYESKETTTVDPKHCAGKPVQLYYWMEREPSKKSERALGRIEPRLLVWSHEHLGFSI